MDRSLIIAHYGAPDDRKQRGDTERMTYKDGNRYQYLLLLSDGKLVDWHKDRGLQARQVFAFQQVTHPCPITGPAAQIGSPALFWPNNPSATC